MKRSLVKCHSVAVDGVSTSVSIEDEYWQALKDIANLRGVALSHLVTKIDRDRSNKNLSSAIRLFVLRFYRERLLRVVA